MNTSSSGKISGKEFRMPDKHTFSFYSPLVIIDSWKTGLTVIIDNVDLLHRLIKVVKVQQGDAYVLFDQQKHALVETLSVLKKSIHVKIISIEKNDILAPSIVYMLPLLKKEALEEAVYSLSEIGVTIIQLAITQKSRQQLFGSKEFDRLKNIVISAAEQSKNYRFPELILPKKIKDFDQNIYTGAMKIVFDPAGPSFFEIRSSIINKNIVLLVGPEGGLTVEELDFLDLKEFRFCALTSTTLRALQAASVSAALFRLL